MDQYREQKKFRVDREVKKAQLIAFNKRPM